MNPPPLSPLGVPRASPILDNFLKRRGLLTRRADCLGQPGLGKPPVPVDGGWRYVQGIGDLPEVESPDDAHLGDVRPPRADGFQLRQRVGQPLDVDPSRPTLGTGDLLFVKNEGDLGATPASHRGRPLATIVDQDAQHHP